MDASRMRSRVGFGGARVILASTLVAGLVVLGQAASAATLHVNCSTENLQSKIDSAPGGSTLLVTGTCIGTFTLSKSLTIEGNPTATLDGNDQGSVLSITGTHTIHLVGLSITGGLAITGAGISRIGGGALTLNRVNVHDNLALNDQPVGAQGGGIYSSGGSLKLTASTVVGNRAMTSSTDGTEADGGGILAVGPLTLVGSTVRSNRATANSFGGKATAAGGGIFQAGPSLTVTASHVDGNRATTTGALGAQSLGGGALVDVDPGLASFTNSTLSGNVLTASAVIGDHPAIATGGAIDYAATVTISGSKLVANRVSATSAGGDASVMGGALRGSSTTTVTSSRITDTRLSAVGAGEASAIGGAMDYGIGGTLHVATSSFSGSTVLAHAGTGTAIAGAGGLRAGSPASLVRSTVDGNHVTATSDSAAAVAGGGGVTADSDLTVRGSTVSRSIVSVNAAGNLAQGVGGGMFLMGHSQHAEITNSTVASNTITSTATGGSTTARARGGGIDTEEGTLRVVDTTLARNAVGATGAIRDVHGGGLMASSGTVSLEATILALNSAASGGPNCSGSVGSTGFNLLGTTNGCTFAAKPSDKLNKDPKLGALADNGGPTLTLALLTGSPALNAIPSADCAVATDQRGVKRPQGPKCDIGSYEKKV